jgi:hypothetical protein
MIIGKTTLEAGDNVIGAGRKATDRSRRLTTPDRCSQMERIHRR